MKKILASILSVVMIFTLAACSSTTTETATAATTTTEATESTAASTSEASFEGETLVVGVWGGTIEDVIRENVVTPMEEEYGCNIELVLGATSDRKAKLYTEAGNPSMDIFFLNTYEAKQAIDDGVAQPVDTSLSNFDQLYDFAQEGGYGMSIMGLGIVYNNEQITEPITSWKDLWNEEYKGKIAFPSYPGFEGDALISVTAMAWGYDVETQIDEIFAKLAELKPVPMFYNSLDELFLELKTGNILAAPVFNSYSNDYMDAGYPITFVYPTDPGPILAKDTIVIAEGTAHEALAKEFVDRCIGIETQTAYAEDIFFGPCNKEVVLSDEVAAKLVYAEDAENLIALDWDYILTQQANWTELWNRSLAD